MAAFRCWTENKTKQKYTTKSCFSISSVERYLLFTCPYYFFWPSQHPEMMTTTMMTLSPNGEDDDDDRTIGMLLIARGTAEFLLHQRNNKKSSSSVRPSTRLKFVPNEEIGGCAGKRSEACCCQLVLLVTPGDTVIKFRGNIPNPLEDRKLGGIFTVDESRRHRQRTRDVTPSSSSSSLLGRMLWKPISVMWLEFFFVADHFSWFRAVWMLFFGPVCTYLLHLRGWEFLSPTSASSANGRRRRRRWHVCQGFDLNHNLIRVRKGVRGTGIRKTGTRCWLILYRKSVEHEEFSIGGAHASRGGENFEEIIIATWERKEVHPVKPMLLEGF